MRSSAAPHPSPLGAATASAIFPGWGQLRTGQRTLGLALVTGSALFIVAAATAVAREGLLGVVGWLVDPDVLLVFVVANLLVATVRVWSTTHAWMIGGGRLFSLTLISLVLFVGIPHAAAGYYLFETRSTLMTVFAAPPAPIPMAAGDTSTSTEATTTTTLPPTTETVRHTLGPPQTNPPPTTTTLHMGTERFTVLLLGGDSGPGRRGLRTDSVIVVTVDTTTGDAAVMGLPRNLGGLTFSDGSEFPGLGRGMLNEAYQWGRRNPERFGGIDPGASAVADIVATLLGLPIDNFVLVDMAGFARVIDHLGGVEVQVMREVTAPLYDPSDGSHTMITIPPGPQTLDGDLALAFARSRTGSSDYDRMGRQRCLLAAVADQAKPLALFAHLPDLLHVLEDNVTTDIPLSKIPYIVNLAPMVSSDRMVVIGFDRAFRDGRTTNGLIRPDVEAIQSAVRSALNGEGLANGQLVSATAACTS